MNDDLVHCREELQASWAVGGNILGARHPALTGSLTTYN